MPSPHLRLQHPYHFICLSLVAISIFLVTPAHGEIHTQVIQYQHGQTSLQGQLAYDDAFPGLRPGILVVHEWWGLNEYAKNRAKQLAALGYVTFALDMYGQGKHTQHPDQAKQWSSPFYGNPIMRQRAQAGLDILAQHEQVDPNRVAAIGYCFGGTTVLELAYSGADIKGAVSFHGGLPAPKPQDLPRTKAKLLICHGADDPFTPQERVDAFRQALQGSTIDWQFITYGNAKHSFTNPGADQTGIEGLAYSPTADQRSWQQMKLFFDELFGPAK